MKSTPYNLFTNIHRDSELHIHKFYYQTRRLRGRPPHTYQRISVLRISARLDFGLSYFSYAVHAFSNKTQKFWLLKKSFCDQIQFGQTDRQTSRQTENQRDRQESTSNKADKQIITNHLGRKCTLLFISRENSNTKSICDILTST